MSSLFENTWSGHDFHLLPDLVLPFEGGIPDVPSVSQFTVARVGLTDATHSPFHPLMRLKTGQLGLKCVLYRSNRMHELIR